MVAMEVLEAKLGEDEKILWSGSCRKDIKALDAVQKPVFRHRLIIWIAVFLAATAFYVYKASAVDARIKVSIPIILVFLVVCAVSPGMVSTDARKVKRLVYAATDRRLMITGDKILEMPYERITEACVRTDPAGFESLLCGTESSTLSPDKWRYVSFIGDIGSEFEEGPCKRFVMYAVDDMEGLKTALQDKINL